MSSPVRPRATKTATLVAHRIVDDVRRGGFGVGDRLPAERLMLEKYKVGRGTLREALRFLELQGVLSLKPGPGGGPTVEKPDAGPLATSLVLLLQFDNAPFSSVVEARCNLEPIMARLAAQRLTSVDLATLAASVDGMRENLTDREAFLQANKDFHELIAWGSGNQVFGFLIDSLVEILDGTILGVDYPDHRRTAILKAHDRILAALLLQDGDLSESSMALHMQEYSSYLSKKYEYALRVPVTWDMLP